MIPADANQPITHEEIARELLRPQTPIVQSVDLAETTFGRQHLDATASKYIVSEALDSDKQATLIAAAEKDGVSFADQFVRNSLLGIGMKLEDADLREKFTDSTRTTRELMEVLHHASSADLLNFTGTLFTLSLVDSDVHNFVVDKVDNALYYMNVFEKRSLLEGLLDRSTHAQTHGMISHVLRSSEDMDEMSELVDGIGEQRLLETGDAQIKEYVAQAIVGPRVAAVRFPERLDEKTSPEQVRGAFQELENSLKEVQEICQNYPELADTQVVRDYVQTAQDDLHHLAEEFEEQQVTPPEAPVAPVAPTAPVAPKQPDPEELERNPDIRTNYSQQLAEYEGALDQYNQQMLEYDTAIEGHRVKWDQYERDLTQYHQDVDASERALRTIANVYSAATRLEFKYGVNITYGEGESLGRSSENGKVGSRDGRWTEEDMADIAAVLEAIPEGHLLASPLLREIQLVDSLGSSVFAARFNTGIVKVAQHTIDSDYIRDSYEGKSPLMMVLIHELGHSVQIGAGPSWVRTNDDGSQVVEVGERIYDFDEFMQIAGWELIDRERWSGGGWSPVYLDGEQVELGTPIDHNGERIVLVPMGWDVLMKFNADGEFSHDDYSHASPWEDFAEAFTEYMFLPERLIEHAPNKFLHLEQEFRKYEYDSRLASLLDEALKIKKGSNQLMT